MKRAFLVIGLLAMVGQVLAGADKPVLPASKLVAVDKAHQREAARVVPAPEAKDAIRNEAREEARDKSAKIANLFPAQTWQPPPPPPPPAPKPTAPPLPFEFGGQLQEGVGEVRVFLTQQKKQLIVREGDSIDNLYKVERISPEQIEFTYLPLQQKQQLMTGRNP